jgi:aerobic C4-dicarboxylate transport protein
MKYLKILYVQVLIGITLGVFCGWLFPSFASTAKLISDTFINMIRMIIVPVIFCSIVTGIAGAGSMKKVGRVGIKALVYFEIVSSMALVIGLIVANLIKPGAGISHGAAETSQVTEIAKQAESFSWGDFISHIVPSNIIESFARGDILQILFFSILFAVGLKQLGPSGKDIIDGLNKINQVVFNILKIVMKLSPIGAFGGMAFTIGKFGFASLFVLGKLMLCFYLTCLLFIFIVLNAICRYYKFSFWKLLRYIRDEILIVFGASSSEAGFPSLMQKLEAAGCEKEVVGLVVPTGYSFNLDGTTIYLSMSVIFLAQVFNVDLSLGQQLVIIGILLITSKGAAGVTGSGFIVLASTLTAMKVIPLEGLALLIGVDRFMSEGRALINFIGNAVATVVISKSEKAIDEDLFQRVVVKR